MSLSYWLRDYLYISLGGNRNGIKITYRNLMLTMLLGGLWHGSSWNFIVWGGIHGVVLSIEKFLNSRQYLEQIRKFSFPGYIITFLVVLLSWIFFRAPDLDAATLALKNIMEFDFSMPFVGNTNTIASAAVFLFLGLLFDLYLFNNDIYLEDLGEKFSVLKISTIVSIVTVLMVLFYSTSENFIYFQF